MTELNIMMSKDPDVRVKSFFRSRLRTKAITIFAKQSLRDMYIFLSFLELTQSQKMTINQLFNLCQCIF